MSRITPSQSRIGEGLKLAFFAVLTFTVVVIVGIVIGEAPDRDAAILGIVYILFSLGALSVALYVLLEKKAILLQWISKQIQKTRSQKR